jgi:hypothetical protein
LRGHSWRGGSRWYIITGTWLGKFRRSRPTARGDLSGGQLQILEFAPEHVVARHKIEIALQAEHPKYAGIARKADTFVAFFDAIECPSRDPGPFSYRLCREAPTQPRHAKAFTK